MIDLIKNVFLVTPFCLVFSILLYGMIYLIFLKRKKIRKYMNYLYIFFLWYCFTILYILFFVGGFSFSTGDVAGFNLIPYRSFSNVYAYGSCSVLIPYTLNILIFIPCGFLLPFVVKSCSSLKRLVSTMLPVILSVELLQLLISRAFDVDDVINNIAGILIGYGLFLLSPRRWTVKSAPESFLGGWRIAYLSIILGFTILPLLGFILYDKIIEFAPVKTVSFLPNDTVVRCDLSEYTSSAMVYKIIYEEDPLVVLAGLKERFGICGNILHYNNYYYQIDDQKSGNTLTYYNGKSKYWIFNIDRNKDIEVQNISNNEYFEFADDFMDRYGFSRDQLTLDQAKNIYSIDKEGNQYISGKKIIYKYNMQNRSGNIYFNFDDLGLRSIEDHSQEIVPYRECSIMSSESAFRSLLNSRKADPNIISAIITNVELEYIFEPYKGHCRPVWRFTVSVKYSFSGYKDGDIETRSEYIDVNALE